jgi:hypothetical protein
MTQARQRVPPDKKIVLVMQAYARNGAWTNLDTLRDLQTATYQQAFDDPRVVAITMFSYGRPSGTREHREQLKPPHLRISEKIFGLQFPGSHCGRRTLVVAAYNSQGRGTLSNTVNVMVGGPGCSAS